MLSKIVNIFVPLSFAQGFEEHFSSMDNVLNELCQLSGKIKIKFKNDFLSFLTIEKYSQKDKEIQELFKDKFKRSPNLQFLKFSSQFQITGDTDYYLSFEYFVETYLRHLLIYLNLAKPGVFSTGEGFIKITDKIEKPNIRFSEFPMLNNSLQFSIGLCKKYKWPPIKELSIIDTLDWLDYHWSAFETISKNKIQRALNSFSYLFHNNYGDYSPSDLFHAMIGLEAIFVIGNKNIQDQVNQKTQLLLGKRKEFKKVFSELYDYRSRYIHGQLDFINKFYVDDTNDIPIDNQIKTHQKSLYASAILISAIQKHIELNKSEFEFEMILK